MWTNPSQKSRQGSDPPPIQAMPAFWEHLDLEPLPYLGIQNEGMLKNTEYTFYKINLVKKTEMEMAGAGHYTGRCLHT